jgi:Fibronectin type III domain
MRLVRLTWLALLLAARPAVGVIRDGGIDPANLGKGDWVYSMTDATNKLGNHISSVTNENSLMLYYKSQGIRYMIVKAGTGTNLFNGCYAFPQFTTALVNIAHANGIWIFGYNRSMATNDMVAEAAVADYVFNQGADGFVWDAEIEWETSTAGVTNGPGWAWQQCSMVRSHWPNKFLAHAPFAIIYLHSSFPYKEFGYWCDAVIPQVYHFSACKGSQVAAINWTDVNFKKWQNSLSGTFTNIGGVNYYWTNAIKPITPLNDVYGGGGSSPCEGTASAYPDRHVMHFIDYATADPFSATTGGYNGVSFWRTDLHNANQWAYIKTGTCGSVTGAVENIVIASQTATKSTGWTAVPVWTCSSTSVTNVGDGTGTDTNSFGTNYLTAPSGTGSTYADFIPNILVPGNYDVYQWHALILNASASVPHIITYNGGTATVYANQQTNDGYWSSLGRFSFATGTSGKVRVTDASLDGLNAIVDGVKLVFVPPTSVPAAPNTLSATPVSTSQINLSWHDAATNGTGFVVSRGSVSGGPYTDIGSTPSGTTNYNDTGLATGTTYYYVVRATNFLGGSAPSSQASASTLLVAPTITGQPTNLTVKVSSNASFYVTATGSSLTYQWTCQGTNIPGATASSYTRFNAQLADAGTYRVGVSNTGGGQLSGPATLTVLPLQPPVITNQPLSRAGALGGSASFSVGYTSAYPAALQWKLARSGITNDLAGQTNALLLLSNLAMTDFGSYSVLLSNSDGTILSAPAALTQALQPAIAPPAAPGPGGFVLTFPTEYGPTYSVEANSNLATAGWLSITNVAGTGSIVSVADPAPNNSMRFYRIRLQ